VKQVYIRRYFRRGYTRFMKYVHDVFDHPKRGSIEKRLEIIKFCDEFGFKATKQAFGKSRSTIYLWKQKLKNSGGKLSALAPGDRSPRNKRHRVVDPFIERFIVEYRSAHARADKTTITPALAAACAKEGIKPVSESTVGRIIRDLKDKGRLPYGSKISIRGGTGTLLVRERLRASRAWRPGPDGYGGYLYRRSKALYFHCPRCLHPLRLCLRLQGQFFG